MGNRETPLWRTCWIDWPVQSPTPHWTPPRFIQRSTQSMWCGFQGSSHKYLSVHYVGLQIPLMCVTSGRFNRNSFGSKHHKMRGCCLLSLLLQRYATICFAVLLPNKIVQWNRTQADRQTWWTETYRIYELPMDWWKRDWDIGTTLHSMEHRIISANVNTSKWKSASWLVPRDYFQKSF